jgi:hypothetical protein
MLDNGHINTSEDIKQAMQPNSEFADVNMDDPKETIKFYSATSNVVRLVSCNRCNSPLCLWILDEKQQRANQQLHAEGLRRITIGGSLLSSRLRLDGQVGYRCKCGNNSIINDAEKGIVPQIHYDQNGVVMNPETSLDIQPHHVAAYQQRVQKASWEPNIIQHGNGVSELEGFTTEIIK